MTQEHVERGSYKPELITPGTLISLQSVHPELMIIDQYRKNMEEVFLLRNPKYRFDKNYQTDFETFLVVENGGKSEETIGSWFYFPWLNTAVHFLPEVIHQELRTGRNRNLISTDEQKQFYDSVIGVLGMSVGSHAAITIVMTGGARHIKLADPDTLSGDNLNRIRTGFQNVAVNKTIAVARAISEINPYAIVEIFPEGVREDNVGRFLEGINILLEEMDDPYWKFRIRELARERRIPVVMGTDNGDGNIVDIERYDLDGSYPILHGYAGKLTAAQLKNLPPRELPKIAAKIAGAPLAPARMLESVAEVGKSLYSWPQLGTAATLCGTTLAYLSRRITLKDPKITSGRYQVNLDAIFEGGYAWGWFSRKMNFIKFVRKMKNQ